MIETELRTVDIANPPADLTQQLRQLWQLAGCPGSAYDAQMLDQYIRSSRLILVGRRGSKIVAYGRIGVDGEDVVKCSFIVDPSCQEEGVGSYLIEQLLAQARAAGMKGFQLEYWERTPVVERLGERLSMPLVAWR